MLKINEEDFKKFIEFQAEENVLNTYLDKLTRRYTKVTENKIEFMFRLKSKYGLQDLGMPVLEYINGEAYIRVEPHND